MSDRTLCRVVCLVVAMMATGVLCIARHEEKQNPWVWKEVARREAVGEETWSSSTAYVVVATDGTAIQVDRVTYAKATPGSRVVAKKQNWR